jgi:hypothetical protein
MMLSLDQTDTDDAVSKLESCVHDIAEWMHVNKLKLNNSKTEIVHFSSKFRSACPFSGLAIGEDMVVKSKTVKDLGVYLDPTLSMTRHVSYVVSSAAITSKNIGWIRKYLDMPTTERLVHAFLSSRLDYCNSILYDIYKSSST